MSEYKAPTVRPAPPEEPDWIDLSLPREVYRPLALLAAFWQVSRENAVGLLIRAVQFQEWPLGDIMTDPAAYQEWALRVTKAATGLRLPTVKDDSLRFDANGWWAGVEAERKEREREEQLTAAGVRECFCVRCQQRLVSQDQPGGLCEECRAGAAAGEPAWLRQVQPLGDETDESE